MKILALIPARGGSKRLPRKNILPLCGKPLIVWSIDVAKDIPEICDILVSTDDPEIAKIAKEAGALVPWLRPNELAADTASSVDTALHALNWYEKEKNTVDGILLLQPTSPFRSKELISTGIKLFKESEQHTVVSVSSSHTHPMWTFKIENHHLTPFIEDSNTNTRSQDLPEAYSLNGSFYLTSPEELRTQYSFIGKNPIPLLTEKDHESLDIDTAWDFEIAVFMASKFFEE